MSQKVERQENQVVQPKEEVILEELEIEEQALEENITPHQFYFETSLYKEIKIETLVEDFFSVDIDAYSRIFNQPTTYKQNAMLNINANMSLWKLGYPVNQTFQKIALTCKRDDNEVITFFIFVTDDSIFKVGQYPSLADINSAEVKKKYNKVLEKKLLINLITAIGLYSHGVGAGAFVYLRKIFESLIKDTFEIQKGQIGILDEDFLKLRMAEKVKTLKDFLPEDLIEIKFIYGILSSGVHELSEEDCKKYFPALKLAIELILDQKIEQNEKEERTKKVRKEIGNLSSVLGEQ